MTNRRIIPAGTRVLVSRGKYEDYTVQMIAEATSDIDIDKLRDDYLTNRPEQRQRNHFDEESFLAWVARQGLLREVAVNWLEWHIGDYGNVDDGSYTVNPWRDAVYADED